MVWRGTGCEPGHPAGHHLPRLHQPGFARQRAGRGLAHHARIARPAAGVRGHGHPGADRVFGTVQLCWRPGSGPLGHRPHSDRQWPADWPDTAWFFCRTILPASVVAGRALGAGRRRGRRPAEPVCSGTLQRTPHELAARLLGHWRHAGPAHHGLGPGQHRRLAPGLWRDWRFATGAGTAVCAGVAAVAKASGKDGRRRGPCAQRSRRQPCR